MFSIRDFYDLIKTPDNENEITNYNLIIGNSGAFGDHLAGLWIIHQINSQVLASPYKTEINGVYKQAQRIQFDFQFDFYISMETVDEVFIEVEKMRAYLASPIFRERLSKLNCEILKPYSNVNYSSETLETNEFLNRGNFDISIITSSEIEMEIDIIRKIDFERELLP